MNSRILPLAIALLVSALLFTACGSIQPPGSGQAEPTLIPTVVSDVNIIAEGRIAPRESVQARFPSGAIYKAPIGAPIETFIRKALGDGVLDETIPIVAALVNGRLRELTHSLNTDAELVPIPVTSGDGRRIYQRSLSFLLVTAVKELFPYARILIDHSLTAGGLFCTVQDWEPFTLHDLVML